jgi:hypothetical protein
VRERSTTGEDVVTTGADGAAKIRVGGTPRESDREGLREKG